MLEDDFKQLRKLCDFHYQRQIDFASYREQRREVLDRIESQVNRSPGLQVVDEATTQPKPKLERQVSDDQEPADAPGASLEEQVEGVEQAEQDLNAFLQDPPPEE